MRLATSTNLLFARPDGTRQTLEKTLELVSEAGFRVFDLNFYDWSLPDSEFLTDGWEAWIERVAQETARRNLEFGQCHAYFFDFLKPGLTAEEYQYHKELQRRSFQCCSILNARVCVLHPETVYTAVDYEKQSLDANQRFFEQVLKETEGLGINIAVENMCDYGIAPRRKFGAYPEQLTALMERLGSDRLGVCWDFEHADIMGQDQSACLTYLKKYLTATHVSDTYSKTDNTLMHVLPMTGTIDWATIMQTLRVIDYQGDFCFEVHNYMNRLPDAVAPAGLKLAYEVGAYLMGLYERSAK